ncbi:KxYKxGKxW signal peptide domain-containing protein [Lactococcus petauri]
MYKTYKVGKRWAIF